MKRILLFTLMFPLSVGIINAQCPTSISEDSGDGTTFIFTLSADTECANFPMNATVNITNSSGTGDYIVTNCATNFGTTLVDLGYDNGTLILGAVAPITFTVGGMTCMYDASGAYVDPCPANISEPEGDGSYYLLPLSDNATCLSTVSVLGGVGANVLINGQDYGVSAASCAASGANVLHLEFNGVTPVVLADQQVIISLGGATCMYTTLGALPVELSSFEGYAKDKTNFLKWQTASESQNKGFDIERSSDGIHFERIGFVAGNGTTNKTQDYRFQDEGQKGVMYYRLKQLDFDGGFEYSKIISIAQNMTNVLSVFPNPSKGGFNIVGIENIEEETFVLINSIGQTQQIKVSSNGEFDMSGLPAGFYYLRVASSGQVVKLLKE